MRKVLVVDDDTDRFLHRYQPVDAQAAAGPHDVRFEVAFTPRAAIDALKSRGDEFAAVVVDCELSASRPDFGHKRAAGTDWQGREYPISTGMGVLDWAHRFTPNVALRALIDTAAAHAPLYTSAALLWLGAKPLDVAWFGDSSEDLDYLLQELDGSNAAGTGDLLAVVSLARNKFAELIAKGHQGIETLDWIGAMADPSRGNGTGDLGDRLAASVEEITGRDYVHVDRHHLVPLFAQWQNVLADIYSVFNVDDAVIKLSSWPNVDESVIRANAHLQEWTHWSRFNPFTDFLGRRPECVEFLTAADVRTALAHYRGRGDATKWPAP